MATGSLGARTYAIVLAGGFGRRLEPVIREYAGHAVPKQFCTFGRGRSLLRETLRRLAPLLPPERTVVVIDQSQERRAGRQLRGVCGVQILPQPCDRGTGAGVLLPLCQILAIDPEARILLTPSDHAIGDERLFHAGFHEGQRALHERLAEAVVFGVASENPATDYGWITPGRPLGGAISEVNGFVEKPCASIAERLHRSGALWNTMVLLASGSALLAHYGHRFPALARIFRSAFALEGADRDDALQAVYPHLDSTDFSRDILGTYPRLAVLRWPSRIGWSDLGTPDRLAAWLRSSARHEVGLEEILAAAPPPSATFGNSR